MTVCQRMDFASERHPSLSKIPAKQRETCAGKTVRGYANNGFPDMRQAARIFHVRVVRQKRLVALRVVELDLRRIVVNSCNDAHVKHKSELAQNWQQGIGWRRAPRSGTERHTRVSRIDPAE